MSTSRFANFHLASRRVVAEALASGASFTLEALGKATGLSEHAILAAADELGTDGIAECNGEHYRLLPGLAYGLGADLGGTKISVALADVFGSSLAEATEITDPRGGRHVLAQIRDIGVRLAMEQSIAPSEIGAVAVGIPGVVHSGAGTVSLGPNIDGLADIDVRAALSELFGRPVLVENDVNLAMLGEASQGSARGCRNAGFVSLGTGVGLGLLVNGALVRGARGAAGEIAYLPLGRDLVSMAALKVGSLELNIGSAGILALYEAGGGVEARTVRDLFALAHTGEALARRVADEVVDKTALSIVALQSVLDLEKIVLGGGIGAQPEFAAWVRSATKGYFARPIDIAVSAFGDRAGLVGAAALAARELRRRRLGFDESPLDFADLSE